MSRHQIQVLHQKSDFVRQERPSGVSTNLA